MNFIVIKIRINSRDEIMLLTFHPGGSTVLAAAGHHCAVPNAGLVLGAANQHQRSSHGKGWALTYQMLILCIIEINFVNR